MSRAGRWTVGGLVGLSCLTVIAVTVPRVVRWVQAPSKPAVMIEGSKGTAAIATRPDHSTITMADTKAAGAVAALAIIAVEKLRPAPPAPPAPAVKLDRKAAPSEPRPDMSGWSAPYGVHGAPSKAQSALSMTSDVGYPVVLRPDYWTALAMAVGCPKTFIQGGLLTDEDARAILRCAQSPVAR